MQNQPTQKISAAPAFNAAALSDSDRLLAFHNAAQAGDIAVMTTLREDGFNVDTPDSMGHTALMLAVMEGQKEAVAQLLAWKADPNAKSPLLVTALSYAIAVQGAMQSDCDIARMLLDAGADPDFKVDGDATALMLAASSGDVAMIELVAAYKPKPNLRDAGGNTAMMLATMNGSVAAMEAVKAAGGSIFTPDNDGASPIHRAAQNGQQAAFGWLAGQGARLDAQDGEGKSVAAHAALGDNARALEELAARKADLDAPDKKGMTPLMHTAVQGGAKAAAALLKAEASLTATDALGRTARDIALMEGNPAIAALIDAEATARLKKEVAKDVSRIDGGMSHDVKVGKPLRLMKMRKP